MRQLIIDTETTGLYPQQGHRIIELAALEVVNRRMTGRPGISASIPSARSMPGRPRSTA